MRMTPDHKAACPSRYHRTLLRRTGHDRPLLFVITLVVTCITMAAAGYATSHRLMYAKQGWTDEQRGLYYFTAQGGSLMPAAWLEALEADDPSRGRFMSRENLERIGLLFDDTPHPLNPYGWPVGMAIDSDHASGIPQAGPTCAFCHTGELSYKGQSIRIDGGQANFDSKAFGEAFGKAVLATGTDKTRRTRFITRAVALGYPKDRIASDFTAFLGKLQDKIENPYTAADRDTPAGPGRMDAVNGIANTIFADALKIPSNARPLDAPVNYPHLWDMWLFDYMQYNASARQPMGRDMAEAIGQPGVVELLDPVTGELHPEPRRWKTLLRPHGLYELRNVLDDLQPPAWPEHVLGKIDRKLASKGKVLFEANCASCHGIKLIKGTRNEKSGNPTEWHVPVVLLEHIGTDPTHALNFSRNTYDGTKLGLTKETRVQHAISALLGPMKRQAYLDAGIPESEWPRFDGYGRPNTEDPAACGYKARPLAGVWATAPFLHNGSVPTVYDLLSDVRPARFHIGNPEYDPRKLGFSTAKSARAMLLDTSLKGNGNGGHWFTSQPSRAGRIGPKLQEQEKYAIIEYLKLSTNIDYPKEEIPGPVPVPCADKPDWAVDWGKPQN